ncbi:hypothetical protein [Sorlinia euscelidii]|uniref:hypothetical protein n=1 Tax=Sorlinia euscelidii TaxID=3081148 RepID=UPI003AAC5E5F
MESYETLRYSDAGYVSDDHTPYPPYVIQGLSLTRALTFSAEALAAVTVWARWKSQTLMARSQAFCKAVSMITSLSASARAERLGRGAADLA